MAFAFTSPVLRDGASMPPRHTCDGAGESPPLGWQDAPPGARSLALICYDPAAPGGAFYHWGLYNMPVSRNGLDTGLPEGHVIEAMTQAVNDLGRCAYGAPCPPAGEPPHRYIFRLHALDTPTLELPRGTHVPQLAAAIRPHTLAEASLTVTYGRSA